MDGTPTVAADGTATLALNGTIFDNSTDVPSKYVPAKFDPTDLKGKEIQVYFTDYVLNTMFEGGFETHNTLNITYLLSKYLNLTVTTDNLGVFIPEILTKYGSGKAVQLSGEFITAASTSHFTAAGQSLDLSLKVIIECEGDKAIVAPVSHSKLHAIISTQKGEIHGKVDTSTLGTMGPGFKTTLGLTGDQLLKELQALIDTNVATLNAMLEKGIVIPKIFGIDVSDIDLEFHEGFLSFGATVVPPAFWENVGRAIAFWIREVDFITSGRYEAETAPQVPETIHYFLQ